MEHKLNVGLKNDNQWQILNYICATLRSNAGLCVSVNSAFTALRTLIPTEVINDWSVCILIPLIRLLTFFYSQQIGSFPRLKRSAWRPATLPISARSYKQVCCLINTEIRLGIQKIKLQTASLFFPLKQKKRPIKFNAASLTTNKTALNVQTRTLEMVVHDPEHLIACNNLNFSFTTQAQWINLVWNTADLATKPIPALYAHSAFPAWKNW